MQSDKNCNIASKLHTSRKYYVKYGVVSMACNLRGIILMTLFITISFMFSVMTLVSLLRSVDTGMSAGQYRLKYPTIPNIDSSRDREKIRNLVIKMVDAFEPPEFVWKRVNPSFPIWNFDRPRGQLLSTRNLTRYAEILASNKSGDIFKSRIRQFALYDPEDPIIDRVIKDASFNTIHEMEEKDGGTQLKLLFSVKDEGIVLFKPGRFNRSYEANANYFYFGDHERHNGEIATFHLDRILGFYRTPPAVGRWINITRDIFKHSIRNNFTRTCYISPAGNKCFHGNCKYFCDTTNAICGQPDMIEGVMIVMFPHRKQAKTIGVMSPWRRSYKRREKATWQKKSQNDTYCTQNIMKKKLYKNRRVLVDIVDMHILDFLIGNLDRHHYEFFAGFPENNTFLIHFDHGRSFGRVKHDEMSILAPLYQCCRIRFSTFVKLLTFFTGPTQLSDFMRQSTSRDPLAPILADGHFEALDRRVVKIILTVADCVYNGNNIKDVLVDDGF